MRTQTELRAVLALLLVATAILFAIGATIERSQRHTESGSTDTSKSETHAEGSNSEAGDESGSAEAGSGERKIEPSEDVLGVDVESIPAIIGAVAAALLLAAAVWWRRERLWLWATLAFGLAFTAGDVREVFHQLDESRTGVAVIAGVLIAAHLAIAVLAALMLSPRTRKGEKATTAVS
jgi:hypothetical protein